jgi:hypothetical protein
MLRRRIPFRAIHALILGPVLLCPVVAGAQHHGGGGTGGGGMHGSVSGSNRPTGLDEKDSLKDFHQAMAVQASGPQITDFEALVKDTESAKGALHSLLRETVDLQEVAKQNTVVAQLLERVRGGNKKWLDGFSATQKSGLKELIKRIVKVDSDVAQEQSGLDQATQAAKTVGEVTARALNLDKALEEFSSQQLALGREMGITLASGQDLTFSLPPTIHPVTVENKTIAVSVSGELTQMSAENGQRTLRLALIADLSDLQQNVEELLRAQLDRSDLCGQRLAIQQARLTPSSPAGLLVVRLHFERWTCSRMMGQQTSNELAEGDGTVEIKLVPSVDKGALQLTSTFGRIDANGMLAESLRSGSLGDDLRAKITECVLAAMSGGADFKTALPPAVQNIATIQSTKFQDAGVGGLSVVVYGQIQISNEQANQLASQLNQALSAQDGAGR